MRIDIMSNMRGVDDFASLWMRRTTVEIEDTVIDVMSLPDLVQAKKTQRDKDWPMVARLVEASYFANRQSPTPQQISFWLKELRTPELLTEVARRFPDQTPQLAGNRPLLSLASAGGERLRAALREEENQEREADRSYWQPLRQELQRLRQMREQS